jgi:DNA-binding GntR family transcriptional regulator
MPEPFRLLYAGRMNRKARSRQGGADLSIRERAYLHIQQLLLSGKLEAGSSVSEQSLAKDLGSSRTPIREAMNQLAAEGLLEPSPNGGMIVTQLGREDIIELYELREALEVYAVGKIARTPLRPVDRDRLQSLVDEVSIFRKELEKSKKEALDEAQMSRFLTCDLGFHALLMSLAFNSRMQKSMSETRLLISVFAIRRSGHSKEALTSIQKYHQNILNAIVKQDKELAMRELSEHIQESQHERVSEYDQWRRETSMRQSMPAFFDHPTITNHR